MWTKVNSFADYWRNNNNISLVLLYYDYWLIYSFILSFSKHATKQKSHLHTIFCVIIWTFEHLKMLLFYLRIHYFASSKRRWNEGKLKTFNLKVWLRWENIAVFVQIPSHILFAADVTSYRFRTATFTVHVVRLQPMNLHHTLSFINNSSLGLSFSL